MDANPVIDVEQLLAPISEEQPSGVELSLGDFDGPLLKVKDAWDEARKLIKEEQDRDERGGIDSMGEPWRTIPPADWDIIIDLGAQTLQQQSKDFRIASWLTEAILRKHHLVGLRDGLELCRGMCERYWDTIRPAPNSDDGHGVTVGAFAGLVSDATFGALLETPIVVGQKPNEREERQYSALDFQRAKDLETISDTGERERLLELGHVEMHEFQAIAALTPPEFHQRNLATIDQCLDTLSEIGGFLREHCQPDEYDQPTEPGVSSFREQLESIRRLIAELGGGGAESEEEEQADDQTPVEGGVSPKQEMTRESAFQTVERVAQFFERTEPHTPVHYALRQAIRWGKMPLPELLSELIADGGVMESLRKQIGLPQEPEQE